MDDFARPGSAARLPAEAVWAETTVGLLDLERAAGRTAAPDEFNASPSAALAGQSRPPFRPLTGDELQRIRALYADLLERWSAVGAGERLELSYVASTPTKA